MKNRIVAPSRLVSALDACRSRLKAFIRGRTPLRDEADDILQEVTYQLIRVEQPVENIAAWLFRAARNEMTDRARKSASCRWRAVSATRRRAIFPRMSWPKRCLALRKRRRMSI